MRIFDRLGLDYVIVAAMSGAMGGSASEEFLAGAENGEDTYVRSPRRLRRQRRGGRMAVPEAGSVRRRAGGARRGHPGHPDDRHARRGGQREVPARRPAVDRGDTLKNVVVMLGTPTARREPLAIGVPGDREVDLKRLEAQVEPAEVEPFDEADFAKQPGLVKGYIGPRRWAKAAERHPLPGRPARRRRHALGHRRERAGQPRVRPGGRPRLHGRRHDRGGRDRRRRPAPDGVRPAGARPRDRDGPHLPARAAGSPRRSTSRCSTRTASSSRSRWARTAWASRAPSRPSSRTRTTSSASSGRARSRPADVHVVATGKDAAIFEAAEQLAAELERPASRCSTTTGRRSRRA